jgi:glycosyltransferase involved in cell wall biosynthesis
VRILHFIWTMAGGGAERQLALLAPALARRGHEVHVAYIAGGVNADALAGRGCALHDLRRRAKYDLTFVARLGWLVRRLRPDIVQTWLPQMDVLGGAAARALRIPWLMTERSAALSYPPALLFRLRVRVARGAARIVANSEAGAEYWRAQRIDPSRIEVVPNVVLTEEIAAAPPLDDARVAPDDQLLVYVGRLSPEKNLGLLIAAMRQMHAAHPRLKLALCGKGQLEAALREDVRAAGLGERVLFAGFVPNAASWLKRAAAAVAVSFVEGHPNAVLEAAAAGAPLILSDIAAYRAAVGADAAEFVPPGDAAALVAAIVRTLEGPGQAAQRAVRARAAVEALSLDAAVTRYENAYRRALADVSAP